MEKTNKKIDTNNMIVLCHIVDEFDEFEKRLISAISPKYNRDFVFQLWDISKGKFKVGARKAKRFYEENKSVIDAMNQYSNVPMFINQNYGWHGEPTGDLRFFYEYLVSHKEEIPKILELLEKLKELGFGKFEFNEELDFTKETYGAYRSLSDNFNLTYVANPQVIPNYTSYINFTTADSNYKMKLELSGIPRKEISDYSRELVLNSLLFDISTLPEKIDVEHTHGHLVRLKNEQQDKTNIIRSSVDLSISVSDLERQFNYTNGTISRLNGVKNKEELVAVLTSMKEDLERLKTLSAEHDSSISQEEPLLTPEVLEQEKTLYLRRREWASIDLC